MLILTVLATLGVAGTALAADVPASGASALTPEQEALARKIDAQLIAPCCWTQTVAVHESDAAAQVKAQVRMLVAQGKGENAVLDTFVSQYGEKILASPRMRGFGSVLYLFPLLAGAAAAAVVIFLLVSWRRRPEPVAVVIVDDGQVTEDERQARLLDELSRFDA